MFNAEKVKNECVEWIREFFEKNGKKSVYNFFRLITLWRYNFMKKLLIIIALSSLFSVFAQTKNLSPQRDESKWSDMTYVNVPILKVLEGKEAYVVIYEKNKVVGLLQLPYLFCLTLYP